MLLYVATKQAESEECAAQTAAVIKWTSRLLEGPANGLRRLHRFTRGLKWRGPERRKRKPARGDDDLDSVSSEQLQAIKLVALDAGALVDAQCEANDQATAWGEQWGSK